RNFKSAALAPAKSASYACWKHSTGREATMVKKTPRKKSTPTPRKGARKKSSARARGSSRTKAKAALRPRRKPRAKPQPHHGAAQKVAGTFHSLIEIIQEADELRNKMLPPGKAES